jgi:hypothetical protein
VIDHGSSFAVTKSILFLISFFVPIPQLLLMSYPK